MFLWFIATSMVAVALVFRSPAVDFRLIALGSVLPLADVVGGRPLVLHTLLAATVVMALIMLLARGRRLVQRRWLGVPIGMFFHLVFDRTWTNTKLFWWPFGGFGFRDRALPEFASLALGALLEIVGVALLVWFVRRFRLDEPPRRQQFLRTGQVGRDLLS